MVALPFAIALGPSVRRRLADGQASSRGGAVRYSGRMEHTPPIEWVENPRARTVASSNAVAEFFPKEVFEQTRSFHRQIPGYQISPLRNLSNLAAMIGVGGIWVKDESQRLSLNSFKVLGGSFAIYSFIKSILGLEGKALSFGELISDETRGEARGHHVCHRDRRQPRTGCGLGGGPSELPAP